MDEVIHVYPIGAEKMGHFPSEECWCEPELTYFNERTGNEIWTHKGTH